MTIARGEEALPTVYVETTVVSYLTARPSRDLVVAAHLEVTRIWYEKDPARASKGTGQGLLYFP